MSKKQWHDRWGADAGYKHGSCRNKWYSKSDSNEVVNIMYISDGTRAVKLSDTLINNIKTRLVLGMKVIKVPKQTMYYTAQLKPVEYAHTITIGGHILRARAVMPFRGTWEFIVITSSK